MSVNVYYSVKILYHRCSNYNHIQQESKFSLGNFYFLYRFCLVAIGPNVDLDKSYVHSIGSVYSFCIYTVNQCTNIFEVCYK